MSKDLLLYGSMYGSNVTNLMQAMDEAAGEDIVIRVSSDGGSPEDTWGIVAKMLEYDGNIKIKVDGRAHSSAAFFLAYADDVEALDISEFLIHRAAYPRYIEQNEDYFTEAMRGNLDRINTSLRKALEAKIDVAAFEKIAKVKMDEIFSMDDRKDVFLNAKQAQKIGLVNSIVKITPQKRAELEGLIGTRIAANFIPNSEIQESHNQIKMTIEEFKAKHPEVFAQAVNQGVEQERDRVGAFMAFADVDLKAVSEGIKSGKDLSKTVMAELSRKAMAKTAVEEVIDDSAKPEATKTEEAANKDADPKAEEEAAKVAEFKKELEANLKTEKH